jgi:hypothetical protein
MSKPFWDTRRPRPILVNPREISPEDEALLRERLRIVTSGKGLWLEDMARTVPHSACFLFSHRADREFCCDIFRILGWLEDGALTLHELNLVTEILDKWDQSQRRCNPLWDMPEPSEEELALNRRILEISDRLISKGQYTVEEEQQWPS